MRGHFTPQFYLSNWLDQTARGNAQLWCAEFTYHTVRRRATKEVAYVKDFYRISELSEDPMAIERALQRLETAAAPVLQHFREGVAVELDEQRALCAFLGVQLVRTPLARGFLREQFRREAIARALAGERVAAALERSPRHIRAEVQALLADPKFAAPPDEILAVDVLQRGLGRVAPWLLQADIYRFQSTGDERYVTSDHPAVLTHMPDESGANRLHVVYPVSPTVMLLACLEPHSCRMGPHLIPVRGMNAVVTESAENQVYAATREMAQWASAHRRERGLERSAQKAYGLE